MRLPWMCFPRTVLMRTAVVLVLAVGVILGAALFLFADQRTEALTALGGKNAAERVAGLVQAVEDSPENYRPQLLRSMESPGFRVGWGAAPLLQASDQELLGLPAQVARHLRDALPDREIRISAKPPGPPPMEFSGPPPDRRPEPEGLVPHPGDMPPPLSSPPWMRRAPPGDPASGMRMEPLLRISVRLNDESWLNVIAPLEPGETLWRGRFLGPLLAALLAVMVVALWAVRQATLPIARFARAAERLGVDVDAPPMAETGPREVRHAAQAFNQMQARIRRFVQDRTLMLAAISHDLRTPITRLKLRAEFVEDEEERTRMLADLDEMERMIASTLAFARDDAAHEERHPTDLATMMQGLTDDLLARGETASYSGPESLVIAARPIALKRAVANLLENAIKYGHCARVSLRHEPGQAVLSIDDDGPGIPEAQHERVFAPFVRLETSRNRGTGGTGLGLAVARAAVRAHGGDIHLSNRAEGGLTVTVSLPIT